MLVSPLMGPILGFTLGTSVRDMMLVKRGIVAETIGFLGCLLVGIIAGVAPHLRRGKGPWPGKGQAGGAGWRRQCIEPLV